MTDYLTEQEQVELLKNWIKQYSLVILTGVIIAIIGITGWRYWQQRQLKILTHASAVYDEMLTTRAQGSPGETLLQAEKLFSHYSQTVYGQVAAFMLARNALLKKDYLSAEKHFRWIIKKSDISSFRQLARLRLARVLISAQKGDEAIKVLEKIEDKNFNGLTNEIRGDAYLAINNIPIAKQAYKQALADLPDAESVRPLLQMKYDNLSS